MRYLITVVIAALSLNAFSQTEYPYPYNPDGNNDGLISLNDLMDLLALYGLEYNAGVLATDSISAIYYTGEMDYWDCTSSCVALRGNWKVLDHYLVGSYKDDLLESQDAHVWLDHLNKITVELETNHVRTLYLEGTDGLENWNEERRNVSESHGCFCQTRTRADIEDINLCEDLEDECGVCNGEGAIYECGCTDIPEGDCDCNGSQLDAIGVCGGACLEDSDGDGVCDPVLVPSLSTLGSGMPTMISNESVNIMVWGEAVLYCDSLSELEYNDWIMPTSDQLTYAMSGGCVIPDTRTIYRIWTRTISANNEDNAIWISLGLPEYNTGYDQTGSSRTHNTGYAAEDLEQFKCRCVR
jgi:hypothetical protein